MRHLPLAETKVLDLSRVLAGPLCTMILGDLGANVIKVERAGRGDETREWGPPFDERGESAYYLSTNRNKLGIAADLTAPRDREMVLRLMQGADVVVENFLPGTLERLGVTRAEEQRRNPALIWCTITGFGAESSRPGYDFVVQAESGWMAITGDPSGPPMKTGVALADVIAGKDAAIAILAALASRSRKAATRTHLVVSLVESARAALMNVAQNALVSGVDARRWGNAHANLVPYQLFETADRPIVVAVGSDAQWAAFARAIGLPQMADDPVLASNKGRLERRDEVVRQLSAVLVRGTSRYWLDRLDAVGVPCGLVKPVLEAIQEAGTASPLLGMPSSLGGKPRLPPPRLDEHGDQIRRLGWQAFSGYR